MHYYSPNIWYQKSYEKLYCRIWSVRRLTLIARKFCSCTLQEGPHKSCIFGIFMFKDGKMEKAEAKSLGRFFSRPPYIQHFTRNFRFRPGRGTIGFNNFLSCERKLQMEWEGELPCISKDKTSRFTVPLWLAIFDTNLYDGRRGLVGGCGLTQ